jgi:hypothetical protein
LLSQSVTFIGRPAGHGRGIAKRLWPREVRLGNHISTVSISAALSFDEGETWPARRLVSGDTPDHEVETVDRRTFIMGKSSAETFGYLAICLGKTA